MLRPLFETPAADLSGGQQQLAMLCIAALGAPPLLVIDGPFIGLAPEMRLRVDELFGELLTDGSAFVVVEQDTLGPRLSGARRFEIG